MKIVGTQEDSTDVKESLVKGKKYVAKFAKGYATKVMRPVRLVCEQVAATIVATCLLCVQTGCSNRAGGKEAKTPGKQRRWSSAQRAGMSRMTAAICLLYVPKGAAPVLVYAEFRRAQRHATR